MQRYIAKDSDRLEINLRTLADDLTRDAELLPTMRRELRKRKVTAKVLREWADVAERIYLVFSGINKSIDNETNN